MTVIRSACRDAAVAVVLMTPRVAVVEDAVGPWSKGGRETRYAALLPRLAQRGLDVEVFSMRWWYDAAAG